ncbi:MAG: ester cyclase [Haloferacaceae archaeon]
MPSKLSPKHDRIRNEARAVVLRLFERGYSKGELSLVTELVASDFVGYSTESSEAYLGPEGIKTHITRLRTAFHGFTIEIDDLQVEGDAFEVFWTAHGTHERRFMGVKPTCNIGQVGEEPHGNRIAVSGVTTGIVRNGKIHESEMVWDTKDLRRQLGESDSRSNHDESEDAPRLRRQSK